MSVIELTVCLSCGHPTAVHRLVLYNPGDDDYHYQCTRCNKVCYDMVHVARELWPMLTLRH